MVSALSSAVDTVEAEVRELVRRRGLDPVEDRLAMRRLIDEVVLDYDERALSSTMLRSKRSGSTSRVACSSRGAAVVS